jgi:hypothetical protein
MIEKDRRETRRDHDPEAVFVQRPYRMFAARATAEVLTAQYDFRCGVLGSIEHEIGIRFTTTDRRIPPAGEQAGGEPEVLETDFIATG